MKHVLLAARARNLLPVLAIAAAAGGNAPRLAAPAATPLESRRTAPQPTPVTGVLQRQGDVHRGALVSGHAVAYQFDLAPDEALAVEVDQAKVDVEVTVAGPGGETLLIADSPTRREAGERVCVVTARGGAHTLTVAPFAGSGTYSIHLVRRSPALPPDRLCFDGARAFQNARRGRGEERARGFEAAAAVWERAGEAFLAGLAWREAGSLRRELGPAARGLEELERALALAREARDAYLEVSVLNRLGLSLADAGRLGEARNRLEHAARRAVVTRQAWGEASALTNLGWLDDLVGQPHRAIDRYTEALVRWRRIDEPMEIAQALQNMAIAYGALDYHDRALDLLAEAAELTRRTGDERREAGVLLAEGWIHYLRGHPADGLPALQRVVQIRRRRGDRGGEAAALDRLGTLWRESGDFAAAERAYLQALALSRDIGNAFDVAPTIANLGCLYAESGRLQQARERLEEARERYRGVEDPRAASHVEFCLAQTARAAGKLDEALADVRRALRIVDRLREDARSRGHYYRPIWLWQDYAELEIDVLFERYRRSGDAADLEAAFQAADLARARTLFERAVETRAGVRGAASESLLDAERSIQAELNLLATRRAAESAQEVGMPSAVAAAIRRQQSELERVRAKIRAAEERHGATAPRRVTVAQIRRRLQPGTALLSFVLGERRSHLLVIVASGLTVYELPPKRDLESHAAAFHRALQESRFGGAQWRLVARELGRELLPKAALAPEVNRLLIVGDGLLHYVPFAAVESPRRRDRLVIDDFEVVSVPSVSVLFSLDERRHHRDGHRVAVFADPVFSRRDARWQANRRRSPPVSSSPEVDAVAAATPQLARLRSSGAEASAIAALAGTGKSVAWAGFDSTKHVVLTTDLRSFDVLHFATHAWIDETFPELSGLAFSRFDRQGQVVESELRLHEIHQLRLDAELTVLSGCQTALGEHVRGNGLEGLAHGFLYAGSARVLVSLWNVHDEATARLMEEFYRALLHERAAPPVALRQAQRTIRRHPHLGAPYYWAPFVLQGID